VSVVHWSQIEIISMRTLGVGPLFDVHKEGQSFDDPPLPRCSQGVPQAGLPQISTLKSCLCIPIILANPNS
jgi:hypothetical protein